MTYEPGDIIEVRWVDIIDQNEWTPIKDAKKAKCPVCKSVGWFLNEDTDVVRIIYTTSDNDECSYCVIPKGCIKSINRVEEAEIDDFNDGF